MIQSVVIETEAFFKNSLIDLDITAKRMHLLKSIAGKIHEELETNTTVNLNFICTHNSRRSQFAQVWSHFASEYYDLPQINSFSGGTEETAFFRNTVKSLQQVGFIFKLASFSHRNPHYKITFKEFKHPIVGYSKRYDDPENKKPYIALTTCSDADENCPFIPDALLRFHLPFTDPKKFDGTQSQSEKYLATSKQIAGELHFIFKNIKEAI